MPPAAPPPASSWSRRSWPDPLNTPSLFTSVSRPALVSTNVASRKNRTPVGRTMASGRILIVGLPEMRRGSATLVTRPSILAPAGITVLPLRTTGCVKLPWNGSPGLLLKVARVVSSLTIRAVPAGTGVLLWAAAMVATSRMQGRTVRIFMTPPLLDTLNILVSTLTVDQFDEWGQYAAKIWNQRR